MKLPGNARRLGALLGFAVLAASLAAQAGVDRTQGFAAVTSKAQTPSHTSAEPTTNGVSFTHGYNGNSTLLNRVLQQEGGTRSARPSGQCTYSCGDALIEVDPCSSGSCPIFDCSSRTSVCPVQ
jgi:hypothetical protein